MSRMERVNKRLIAIIVLLIVLLVSSNIAWMVYESQFEMFNVEQDVDQENEQGNNIFVGGDLNGTPAHQNDGQDKS